MGHRCILSCLVAVDMYRVVGLPSFVLFVCLFVFSPLFCHLDSAQRSGNIAIANEKNGSGWLVFCFSLRKLSIRSGT